MDVRGGLWRKLSTEELMLLNCGVGEDSWESLGLQRVPTSPSEGDQPWVFFGRNDAKSETAVLWPPHAKSWLIGKDSDAGMDWGQEEKGTTEGEVARWHHWLDGREFEWTPGDGDGQGGLACCDSWDHKESDTTEWLNWTELRTHLKSFFFILRHKTWAEATVENVEYWSNLWVIKGFIQQMINGNPDIWVNAIKLIIKKACELHLKECFLNREIKNN